MIDKAGFRQRLRAIGLDQVRFARIVHVQPDTLYRWGDDIQPWAVVLLVSWELLHAIHGKAWLDYLVSRLADED